MLKFLYKMITKSIIVKDIIHEADETITYKFNIPKGIDWESGANGHFVVKAEDGNFQLNKTYVRHLSIMNTKEEGFIGFTTRIKDNPSLFKSSLENYKIGDEMRFFGIKNHIPFKRKNSNVVFISMGVGIATFRPMIKDYLNNQDEILSVTNINIDGSGQFVYHDELSAIKTINYKNEFVTNRDTLYDKIQDTFRHQNTDYYIVGSDEFLKNISSFLVSNTISKSNIHLDKHDFQKTEFFKTSA